MILSVGVLYDCQKFIALCDANSFLLEDVRGAFQFRYEAVPISSVLDMIRVAQWVSFGDDGRLRLTARGREILACRDAVAALRIQIMDYIIFVNPSWSGLIPRGRKETLQFLAADARQCFDEAFLSDGYDRDVVAFWDLAANLSRGRATDVLLEIGREGERLSIEYETLRTGRTPVWKAIDSNLAGYDLLSIVSREDERPLKIEVKATGKVNDRAFYVSKNEWLSATGYGEFALHLWLLGKEPQLIVKRTEDLEADMPIDQRDGSWQSVKVTVLD